MSPLGKTCVIVFDEIFLLQNLTFNITKDKVVGYVDLGPLGRRK